MKIKDRITKKDSIGWKNIPKHSKDSCEVCGRDTDSLFTRIIDGATMNVCYQCKDLGEEPAESRKKRIQAKTNSSYNSSYPSAQSKNSPPMPFSPSFNAKKTKKRDELFIDFRVVADAPEKLTALRNQTGSTVDKFAETLNIKRNDYARIEKGETALPLDLAKRIEKKYKIKLLEKDVENEEDFEEFQKAKKKPAMEGMVYFRKRGEAPEYDQDLVKKD